MVMITAAVLTKDEESRIERCLRSIAWADEVLVADSGSRDATTTIARELGARVETWTWDGFRVQRERAIAAARGDYVLFLDADEWVDPSMASEVRRRLASADVADGYYVSRRNFYLDRFLTHAYGRDLILRLFRKGSVRIEGVEPHVHQVPLPGMRTAHLDAPLFHEAYRSIDEMVAKSVRYANDFATPDATDALYRPHRLITSPASSFLKCLVLKGGWRDGGHGLVVAVVSAFYHFLKHAKKWEKLRRRAQEAGARG